MNDDYSEESAHSAGLNWDKEAYETEDLKPVSLNSYSTDVVMFV